jgi:ferrous iron transport protein A
VKPSQGWRALRLIANKSHKQFKVVLVRLDQLPLRQSSRIASIDWAGLAPREARRLRELGFDDGVAIEALHRGAMKGPLACRVGRMIVALRRVVAAAVIVEPA